MDDLDRRLRGRLERLADGVPIVAAPVQSTRLRRGMRAGRQPSVAAAIVLVVLATVVGLAGVAALREVAQGPSASGSTPAPLASSRASAAASLPLASPPAPAGAPSADRYGDGIPMRIGGAPVLRGRDALDRAALAAKAGDTSSFLVGGWVTVRYGPFSCGIETQPRGWGGCGQPSLSDVAGSWQGYLSDAFVWEFLPADAKPATGPVVVSVHVNDPRASECAHPELCGAQMVVLSIEWTGDDATMPAPISAAAALAAVEKVDASTLVPYGPSVMASGCSQFVPGAQVYLTTPETQRMPSVTSFTVAPSTAALRRGLADFPEGADGVWAPKAWLSDSGVNGTVTIQCRVLRVANIAVVLQLHPGETEGDKAFVRRLAAALETAR